MSQDLQFCTPRAWNPGNVLLTSRNPQNYFFQWIHHLSTWPQGVDNTISKITLGPIVQPQHPQCGNDGWSWPHQDPPSLLPKNAVINCFGLLGCPSFSLLLRPRPFAFLPIQWRLLQSTVQKTCKSETQPELPSLLKNLELKKGWDEKSDTPLHFKNKLVEKW